MDRYVGWELSRREMFAREGRTWYGVVEGFSCVYYVHEDEDVG